MGAAQSTTDWRYLAAAGAVAGVAGGVVFYYTRGHPPPPPPPAEEPEPLLPPPPEEEEEEEAEASTSGSTPPDARPYLQVYSRLKPTHLTAAFAKLKKTEIYESVHSEAAKVITDSELPSTSDPKSSIAKSSSGNSVLVSPKQRGNPLLKSISSVPWEFDDSIVPDYVMGRTTCALFLSLKYHNLKPDYINERLKQLGKLYDLRVLLVQVDLKDPYNPLKHLTRVCLLADLTLMLAWSSEEAGKIIETYKIFEHKPPDMIMERQESDPHVKLVSALTSVRSINKTDATTLLSTFGSLGKLVKAGQDSLALCPGLGPQKASRLYKTLHLPFLKDGKPTKQKVGITKFLKD